METNGNGADKTSELRDIQHEVNNALTGIVGHAQLMLMRGQIDDKSRERVVKIDELAQRIRVTISKISD